MLLTPDLSSISQPGWSAGDNRQSSLEEISLQAAIILPRLVGLAGIVGVISEVILLSDLQFVFRVAQAGLVGENLSSVNVKFMRSEIG